MIDSTSNTFVDVNEKQVVMTILNLEQVNHTQKEGQEKYTRGTNVGRLQTNNKKDRDSCSSCDPALQIWLYDETEPLSLAGAEYGKPSHSMPSPSLLSF